jgi:hypothetical protein
VRELQLLRSPDDKRRLDLAGVGYVRFENMWGTKLVLVAASAGEWRVAGRLMFRGETTATDAAGTTVAKIAGNRVEYGDRTVEVTTPHEGLLEKRPPYLVVENGREIAHVASQAWSEKPLDVSILDEEFVTTDPLLFLLALYTAQLISARRSASAAAGGVG